VIDRLTPEIALGRLKQAGGAEFINLFGHGSLEVEIYRPVGVDRQRPHARDEIYVVIAGSGYFRCGLERRPFEVGEVLFVPAGEAHKFEEFSEDFSTWVFFYGREGGEVSAVENA
jgi:mannose-6-phosphate isomerase-like protein (cupin superfamily)